MGDVAVCNSASGVPAVCDIMRFTRIIVAHPSSSYDVSHHMETARNGLEVCMCREAVLSRFDSGDGNKAGHRQHRYDLHLVRRSSFFQLFFMCIIDLVALRAGILGHADYFITR
jgi:hypothetical protein